MLTEVKNNIKIMFLSFKYNMMKEMENKAAFITSILMMIFNNATFIIQWITIFTLKDYIGSYNLNDVMLFWAVSSGSYGLAHMLFHGARKIPEYIEYGKLDSFLVSPKNVLCYVITSSSSPSAIGDLLYGYIALIIFNFSIKNILIYTILIILACLIYTAHSVIVRSIIFRFTKSNGFEDTIDSIILNGSLYPDVIFNRAIKIIFMTLIPCALASWLPVSIILDFSILKVLLLVLATIFYTSLAFIMFNRGLKHYSSSNLIAFK